MLLGATAMGTTTIINAACDPEVEDLAEFLNGCGASIYGAGEKKIVIDGVKTLGGCRHTVMPDISFTAFLLAAAAITGSKLAVENTSATGMEAFLNLLLTCGFVVKTAQNRIEIKQAKFFDSPKNVLTCTYPGLTPQMLPMAAAILAKANGVTVLCDDTPNNLSNICAAVQAFGGDVSNCTGRAVVKGIKTFGGAEFCPKNLSDAQAALLCAIAADTQSTIENAEILEHIYENLPGILKKLGCKIRKI
jgi:UDP-N-acetylglucosamine 1-carboxyvinyltransferase